MRYIKRFNISSYQTLKNFLLGAVSLTKNADIDKYKYFGYNIGFDEYGYFSNPISRTCRNVIIFREHMSSSTKVDTRK